MESAFFGTRRAAGLLQQFRRLSFLIRKPNLFLRCVWMRSTTFLKNSVGQQLMFNLSPTFPLSFLPRKQKATQIVLAFTITDGALPLNMPLFTCSTVLARVKGYRAFDFQYLYYKIGEKLCQPLTPGSSVNLL